MTTVRTIRVPVRVNPAHLARIDEVAASEGTTSADLIRDALLTAAWTRGAMSRLLRSYSTSDRETGLDASVLLWLSYPEQVVLDAHVAHARLPFPALARAAVRVALLSPPTR